MKYSKYILTLLSVAMILSGCILFKPSPEKMTRRALKANSTYDVIIVPGVQFEEPVWSMVMQLRLIWAKHLYDRGLAKNIITSGSSVYTPYVEAQVMSEYLQAMGIPKDKIFTEERAEHSTENLWYGFLLARKKGFKSIAVASDPFQSKLLYRFAKKRTNKQVYFLPAIFDTLRTLPHDTPVINYQKLKLDSFIPITKKYSNRYNFRGTMGKHINFKAE